MKNRGNTRKTNKKAVIAGIALAVIMIGGTLAAFLPSSSKPTNSSNSSSNNQNPNEIIQKLYNPVVQNASALGSNMADITIIEFADYLCQSCAKFHREVIDDILRNFVNTGQVRFLFKDFIVNNDITATTNEASTLAAEASYCAAEQGKYWEYHDKLYQNAENEKNIQWVTIDNLKQIANNAGIGKVMQFSDCLESHKHSKIVNENDNLARSIGLQSTPTFILLSNRTQPLAIQGSQPYAIFEQAVREIQSSSQSSSS
ncbi:MAG TPA: thioredoxin domain-containing protein [Nitrososphaeraceae archaeon]|nr:thioredoxin domain-containing protein [Nitrososphaeraceae archaeon]